MGLGGIFNVVSCEPDLTDGHEAKIVAALLLRIAFSSSENRFLGRQPNQIQVSYTNFRESSTKLIYVQLFYPHIKYDFAEQSH